MYQQLYVLIVDIGFIATACAGKILPTPSHSFYLRFILILSSYVHKVSNGFASAVTNMWKTYDPTNVTV
jgi:hypothetical protein